MPTPQTLLLSVRVRPAAKQPQIIKLSPVEYRVSVVSPAEKGKANREVRAMLAEYLGISASQVRIVRGEKSRLKLIAVEFDA